MRVCHIVRPKAALCAVVLLGGCTGVTRDYGSPIVLQPRAAIRPLERPAAAPSRLAPSAAPAVAPPLSQAEKDRLFRQFQDGQGQPDAAGKAAR